MFPRLLLLILLTTFSSVTLLAQSLKLTGKVLNEKNEPLPGVSIKNSKGGGSTSDVDGAFSLTLAAGNKYELVFSAVGYAPKTISDVSVASGQSNELNVVMAVAAKDLAGVVVQARSNARRESTNALIQYQRNTNTVAQVVSAEAIRRSPDRSTGEVLKRVPGTSIQDGKYLIVRGLSDRYNQAMLNGILLVSTEPDRKTFSFDLFPSGMIDNIIINKAFVPELPGEWAGGLVQVNTKDIPSKSFFTVQAGTGFNSQTIGHDFYRYKGGKYDWLGFDDGTRKLPNAIPVRAVFESDKTTEEQKVAYAKMLPNTWSAQAGSMPLNAAFQLSGGFNTNLFGKKAGGVLALSYNRSNRRLPFTNTFQSVADGTPSIVLDYNNTRYAQDVLWGALGNFSLQLDSRNKISIKNLFNVSASDYTTLRTGLDLSAEVDSIRGTELGFRSTIYNNTQLIGEHNISDWNTRVKWYGSFTILDQYTPDQRRLQYNKDLGEAGSAYEVLLDNTLSQRSGNRFFANLNDYVYSGGGDIAKSFKWLDFNQTIKAGYMMQVRDRLFDARPFSVYVPRSSDFINGQLKQLDESQIFNPENFDANDDYKFHFNQMSNIKFRYMANNILNAGYLQFDNQFSDAIRLVWGARAEHFDQLVGSVYTSDSRHFHTKQFDILPGANLTYKLNEKTNLRFSASQTVIRPELRELVEYEYYDFDLNASVKGLPTLKRTKVTNADIRYEMYPRAGEMFTVGAFFKHFKSPIEAMFNQASGGASSYNFVNAPDAQGFGLEVEGRKKLDFVAALKNFTVFGNLSYIYNRVNFDNKVADRPMQGQSPYLVNVGVQYDHEKSGINTTLLFNQIGRRIVYVGGSDAPAIWERPRPLLDFQVAKKLLNKRAEIKLNVSDILNKENFLYYDVDENEQFKRGKDAIFINRKMGTTFGLSFAYNFIQQ